MRHSVEPQTGHEQKTVQPARSKRPLQTLTDSPSGLAQLASMMNGSPRVQHLANLASEVNQDAQQRTPVQPTVQMKSVAINGDSTLEQQADVISHEPPVQAMAQGYGDSAEAHGIQGGLTLQRLPEEEEQIAKEEQNAESFSKLITALDQDGSTAVVRIVARTKSAAERKKSWKWENVGHSSIQLTVNTTGGGARSLHIQIGLDNGGSVKIEGNLYKEATSDKYDIVMLEQSIGKEGALTLIGKMREEVGKAHSYKEWIGPGFEKAGYENCTTWALKMGTSAGLSVPSTLGSSFGVTPDPGSLADRIRSKTGLDAGKSERRVDLKHGDPAHQIGQGANPNIILGDTTSDEDAAIWGAARAILEARERSEADPAVDSDSVSVYLASFPDRPAAYAKAVTKANTVARKAQELRTKKAHDAEAESEFYWQSFAESVSEAGRSIGGAGGIGLNLGDDDGD